MSVMDVPLIFAEIVKYYIPEPVTTYIHGRKACVMDEPLSLLTKNSKLHFA